MFDKKKLLLAVTKIFSSSEDDMVCPKWSALY